VRRFLAPLIIGLAGAAVLMSLGLWQVERLAWKEGVLAEIAAQIEGPAQPLPRTISQRAQRYMPVALEGEIGAQALYVLVSAKQRGAGWRVISPFETDDGRRVLVDRGFLPVAQKEVALTSGTASVVGNLHWPDDRNASTPQNDVAGNIWYARDLGPMAEILGTEPLLVVARDLAPPDDAVTPMPVDTSGIPNDHLEYAATWFGLAAIWVMMTGLWLRARATGKDR
jgi:surfeit locus 1 family protein